MAIEIIKFRSYQKNTLRGFLTIRLTNIGLEIRDMTVHEKNGKRWVALPAKPYEKESGGQGWSYIVTFYDKARGEQFQKACIKAFDTYLADKENAGETGGR